MLPHSKTRKGILAQLTDHIRRVPSKVRILFLTILCVVTALLFLTSTFLLDQPNEVLPFATCCLLLSAAGAILLLHTIPSVHSSRFAPLLQLPICYWVAFILISSWLVWAIWRPPYEAFCMPLRGYPSVLDSFLHVVNIVTYSDRGGVVPITMLGSLLTATVQLAQVGFVMWFIIYFVGRSRRGRSQRDLTQSDFAQCQSYMEDILTKSQHVNVFFRRLESDIESSQRSIAELEKKRSELKRLKSIEQDQVKALISSLGEVVGRELKKTKSATFVNNLAASALVALVGYLVGKVIEAVLTGG